MAFKHAGRWATVKSSYKILKGQEFTPLCKSWTATLLSFYKQGMHGVSVAEWTQHGLWQSASQGDLFQPETNTRTKHFAASTPITTAGFTRQKIKHFHSAKAQESPQMKKGQSNLSWSKLEQEWGEMVTRHLHTPETCADFGRERRVLTEEALRPEGSVVQENPPVILEHGCSCSIYCTRHDSAAKLSRAKLQNLTSQLNRRKIFYNMALGPSYRAICHFPGECL